MPVVDATRRCYCNDISCVSTGYMCKTTMGTCFAQRSPGAGARVHYACVNWLADDDDRRLCLTSAVHSNADYVIRRRVTSSHYEVTWSELACCSADMCNYYYFRPPSQQIVAAVDVRTTNGKLCTLHLDESNCKVWSPSNARNKSNGRNNRNASIEAVSIRALYGNRVLAIDVINVFTFFLFRSRFFTFFNVFSTFFVFKKRCQMQSINM